MKKTYYYINSEDPICYIKIDWNHIFIEAHSKDHIARDEYHAGNYKEWQRELIRDVLLDGVDRLVNHRNLAKAILVILDPSHSDHVYMELHKSLLERGYEITRKFDDGKRIIYERNNSKSWKIGGFQEKEKEIII